MSEERVIEGDRMQSEGPYFITQEQDKEIGATWFLVNGPGIDDPKMTATADSDEAIVSASIRNRAYIEGQKAEVEKLHREIMGDINEPIH
jgi:hypothetical protein